MTLRIVHIVTLSTTYQLAVVEQLNAFAVKSFIGRRIKGLGYERGYFNKIKADSISYRKG